VGYSYAPGKTFARAIGVGIALIIATVTDPATSLAVGPVAVSPYTLTPLTTLVPPTGATQPDDLAVSADGADLWVGYGNGVATDGSGGPSSLVEYEISSSKVLQNVSIPGHLDGLKINPKTGDIWATENEDKNPTLAIVNHKNGKFKIYTFSPTLITGGMDDLVFSGPNFKDVFIVASSQADTTTPVIVEFSGKPKKTATALTAVLAGAPTMVFNVVTNATESNDLIGDPDSMTIDPAGELVFCNRKTSPTDPFGDSLYIVRASSATHPVLRVPLTVEDVPIEVNDTIFTTSETTGASSTAGVIYITATSANVIYSLTKPYFPANEVYTAANVLGDVGLVDLNTGIVTPVVTGLTGVHGLAFSPTPVAP
jgi:hypothetical protein